MMDLRKIKTIIELMESSDLMEMEISEGDNSIRLSRMSSSATSSTSSMPTHTHLGGSKHVVMPSESTVNDELGEAEGQIISSPMVGTFYDSPSPDTSPYVRVGSVVKPGDILCIIEAMKTFNQLDSEISGKVETIYKNSGEPVEFGESLFLIK